MRSHSEAFDIPTLKSRINDGVKFTRILALENGIYAVGDRKAENETDQLIKEILLLLNK